jgi:hypothetical protein
LIMSFFRMEIKSRILVLRFKNDLQSSWQAIVIFSELLRRWAFIMVSFFPIRTKFLPQPFPFRNDLRRSKRVEVVPSFTDNQL